MNILFTMIRGDTVNANLSVLDPVDDPFDLTGCDVWVTAKRRFTDPDEEAVFQKTIGDGVEVTNEVGGEVRIVISPDDTSSLEGITRDVNLVLDVQIRTPDGEVFTPILGIVVVTPDVTIISEPNTP